MVPTKHKWLGVYLAPNGKAYYLYRKTKAEIKDWATGREGITEYFRLSYQSRGKQIVKKTTSNYSYDRSGYRNEEDYFDIF